MSRSKYDIFYSKFSYSELLEQALKHRIEEKKLDPLWYDALIAHINGRTIFNDQETLKKYIFETAPELLPKEIAEVKLKIKNIVDYKKISEGDDFISNAQKIRQAGEIISEIGIFLVISIFLSLFSILLIVFGDAGNLQITLFVLGLIQLIIVGIIINKFFAAGEALKSVREGG